jgi:hypothetical protein
METGSSPAWSVPNCFPEGVFYALNSMAGVGGMLQRVLGGGPHDGEGGRDIRAMSEEAKRVIALEKAAAADDLGDVERAA